MTAALPPTAQYRGRLYLSRRIAQMKAMTMTPGDGGRVRVILAGHTIPDRQPLYAPVRFVTEEKQDGGAS
jgi:hypothetical protein